MDKWVTALVEMQAIQRLRTACSCFRSSIAQPVRQEWHVIATFPAKLRAVRVFVRFKEARARADPTVTTALTLQLKDVL